MSGAVVSGSRAALLIAQLALVRLARGRTWWITLPIVVVVPALLLALNPAELPALWSDFLDALMVPVLIVPPIHLAGALAEETEDRTITYLWSRPVPRWSLIAGKLLALVPIIAAALAGVTAVGFAQAYGGAASASLGVLGWSAAAVVVGVIATSCLSVGLGCLIPRQSTAVAIVYVIAVDLPLSTLGFAIQNVSFTHQVLALAGGATDAAAGLRAAAWLAGLSAAWLGLAVWRVSRAQLAAQD